MAMEVRPIHIGIDVSKSTLVIANDDDSITEIANEAPAIRRWLKSLPGPARIGVEATGVFHVELIERAHQAGHAVYVIDGFKLNRYRDSVGGRAKTDASDAQLLRRYLTNELKDLSPWSPSPKGYRALQNLLLRRAKLVQCRTRIDQSLRGLTELGPSRRALLRQIDQLDRMIVRRIYKVLRSQQWYTEAKNVQGIEGIGELISAALVMAYHRGRFRSSDAFIAFIGLDVRIKDSGTLKGRRKLTKKGSPELRRLLYLAAMTASRSATWAPFYQRYLDRGLATTEALIILARKLARVAFALLKNGTQYKPKSARGACIAT
jgi:transposase